MPPVRKRMPSYVWHIAAIVTEFYFTTYICSDYIAPGRETYRVIELYGRPENLDTAEYVYRFLLDQGEREWERYKQEHGLPNRRYRLSFLKGLYSGYYAKLAEQTESLARDKALVWTGDPKLDEYFRRRNPRVSTMSTRGTVIAATHADGVAVGRELTIQPGLGESAAASESGPRLLS